MPNKRFWIISLPRPDMEHCIKAGVFGLKKKYSLGSVRADDELACYITKEAKIIALGEVTKGYYPHKGTSSVFLAAGTFPHRIEFKGTKLAPELDFKSLIPDFRFITNKAYWGAYLQLGITEIPNEDWALISERANLSTQTKTCDIGLE